MDAIAKRRISRATLGAAKRTSEAGKFLNKNTGNELVNIVKKFYDF